MSVDLESQLRAFFTEFDAMLEPVEVEELVAKPIGRGGGPVWRPLPGWAVAAVTAAVVLIAFGVVFLFRPFGGESPVATETPTTVVTTTLPETTTTTVGSSTTSASTTTGTPVPPARALRRAAISQPEGAQIAKVIAGGPGLVAVGTTSSIFWDAERNSLAGWSHGVVWVSSDGVTWDAIEHSVFGGADAEHAGFTQSISDVVSGPRGLVAVGSDQYEGAVWTSSDGFTWSRVFDADLAGNDIQDLVRVVAGGPGVVAAGRNGSTAGVWTSPDGAAWTRIEDPDFGSLQHPAEIRDLAAGPEGLVAIGSGGFGESDRFGLNAGSSEAFVWYSSDGTEWDILAVDLFGDPGSVYLESVEGSEDGFTVQGRIDDRPVSWTSPDGRVWTPASPAVSCETEDPRVISISEPPGAPCRGVGFLEIADGVGFDVDDVIVIDLLVVVTGTVTENDTTNAAIWTGPSTE